MSAYALLKALHMATALISVTLFLWRLMLDQLQRRWRDSALRWLPHANDTLLLSAAIAIAVMGGWNPLQQSWLMAKIVLLLGYIAAGREALRATNSMAKRRGFALLALALVTSIIVLARLKPAL